MSSSVSPTTTLLVDLASVLPLLVVLAFFGLHPHVRGHSIHVGQFGLGVLHDVQYAQKTAKSEEPEARGSVATLRIRFRFPRPSNPTWCTVVLENFAFADSNAKAKLEQGIIELSVFPRAVGTSAGPWVSLVLSGLDITVCHSSTTPGWVQRVRTDVVRTLLMGTILRADYTRTAIHMTPPAHAPDADIDDEMVFSASARGLQVRNARDRMYDVRAVEWGCRRSWLEGGGAMWLVAEDVRWTKQYATWQSKERGWRYIFFLFLSITSFRSLLPAGKS